jgi:hypothetical protein
MILGVDPFQVRGYIHVLTHFHIRIHITHVLLSIVSTGKTMTTTIIAITYTGWCYYYQSKYGHDSNNCKANPSASGNPYAFGPYLFSKDNHRK